MAPPISSKSLIVTVLGIQYLTKTKTTTYQSANNTGYSLHLYSLSPFSSSSSTVSPVLLGRIALVRGVAGYSHQTFPWTICRSVCLSVCPVHSGKTADRIRMPFGTIGRTGPGMRQVVRFGDRSTGRGTFGGEFGGAPS